MIIKVGQASPQEQRAEKIKQACLLTPGSLNFPAFFFDFFIYGRVVDQTREYDTSFRMAWRAVVWPWLGIVFWWMAGRAVEALAAARKRSLLPRIGPPEVTVAFALIFFGAGLSLAFVFGEESRDLDSYLLGAGAALWALIGAVMLLARIVQWRVRKATRAIPDMTPLPNS
ncbi:MAG TPA: hypothetical protein VI685_19020 [Candidatus Angelobacter sp.]